LSISRVVLDANKARIRITLEPSSSILEKIQIAITTKLHIHRITEILTRHESLDGDEVAARIHRDRHDPAAQPVVDKKFSVVILRERSHGTREFITMKNRT